MKKMQSPLWAERFGGSFSYFEALLLLIEEAAVPLY